MAPSEPKSAHWLSRWGRAAGQSLARMREQGEKGVVQWETKCIPCSSAAFLHTARIWMVSVGDEVLLLTVDDCVWGIIFAAFYFCLVCCGLSRWTETYLVGAAVQLRRAPPLPPLTHCPHLKLTHTVQLRAQALFSHIHEAAVSALYI